MKDVVLRFIDLIDDNMPIILVGFIVAVCCFTKCGSKHEVKEPAAIVEVSK